DSYLNIPHIMAAAEITNADGIHPGYGFLAENAKFAEICGEHGIKFIGPTPSLINAMGDKITAKETMIKAGVPVVPGGEGLLEHEQPANGLCLDVRDRVTGSAPPVGGGNGGRVAFDESDGGDALATAYVAAAAAFKKHPG